MASEPKTSNGHTPITVAVFASVVVIALIVALALGMAGSYLLSLHAIDVSRHNTQAIIAADNKAAEGRSKALCFSLKQLGATPKAHKLHSVFVSIYENSGCVQVTGDLPKFER